jgi:hypothetical protein
MSLSQGALTLLVEPKTKYAAVTVATSKYTVTATAKTSLEVDVERGIFLGFPDYVASGYVVSDYFMGAELF